MFPIHIGILVKDSQQAVLKSMNKNPFNPCMDYCFLSYKPPHDELCCRKTTPLHIAARKGHIDVCRLILENTDHKIPTDDVSGSLVGNTPFHLAAENGHIAICQLLIENRQINFEDTNPRGCNGLTKLLYPEKGNI